MKSQTTTSVLSVQKPTLRRASFYIGAPVLFQLCTAKEQFFAPKMRTPDNFRRLVAISTF